MDYRPYFYCQRDWPFRIIYNEYHDKYYARGDEPERVLIVRGDEIIVQGMWRMQMIGELHSGLRAPSYDDLTVCRYCNNEVWQNGILEESENRHLDSYADYFEELAGVAAEIGCERAEIKCLIKSLMLKYRMYRLEVIDDLPHEEFGRLYNRLLSSNDMEQLRVAERLGRIHVLNLEWFMWCDIQSAMMRVERSVG